jgi:hypothetical protein
MSRNRGFFGPRGRPNDFRGFQEQNFYEYPYGPVDRFPAFRERSPIRRDPRYQYDFGDYEEGYFSEGELRREYFEPDFYQKSSSLQEKSSSFQEKSSTVQKKNLSFIRRERRISMGIDRKMKEAWRTIREKIIGHGGHLVVKK